MRGGQLIAGEKKIVWTSKLDNVRCWDLLASHPVGGVAFASGDDQIILRVNYFVQGGQIVIRTGSAAILDGDP